MLDDGRITDSQGRTVDFKNTIIILTSNLGSPYILEGIGEDGEISEDARKKVEELLHQQFRPEFLNRLDEIIYYKPLMRSQIDKIVDLMLGDLQKRLQNKHLSIEVTNAAKSAVIEQGYDQNFGARPLKRFIQRRIETLIAKTIIADDIAPESVLRVDYNGTDFTVETIISAL